MNLHGNQTNRIYISHTFLALSIFCQKLIRSEYTTLLSFIHSTSTGDWLLVVAIHVKVTLEPLSALVGCTSLVMNGVTGISPAVNISDKIRKIGGDNTKVRLNGGVIFSKSCCKFDIIWPAVNNQQMNVWLKNSIPFQRSCIMLHICVPFFINNIHSWNSVETVESIILELQFICSSEWAACKRLRHYY